MASSPSTWFWLLEIEFTNGDFIVSRSCGSNNYQLVATFWGAGVWQEYVSRHTCSYSTWSYCRISADGEISVHFDQNFQTNVLRPFLFQSQPPRSLKLTKQTTAAAWNNSERVENDCYKSHERRQRHVSQRFCGGKPSGFATKNVVLHIRPAGQWCRRRIPVRRFRIFAISNEQSEDCVDNQFLEKRRWVARHSGVHFRKDHVAINGAGLADRPSTE